MTQRKHLTPEEAAQQCLKPRTHWKPHGLMPAPSASPVATVWQGQGSYPVYHRRQCVPWRHRPGPTERRRREAAGWAARWLEEGIIVDCETTGLDDDDEIVEIAILDAGGGEVLLDTLVQPSRSIPASATAIHGITDDQVAAAPAWPDVQAEVVALLEARLMIAYNKAYDLRMLYQMAYRHGRKGGLSGLTHSLQLQGCGCAMRLFAHWWSLEGNWWKLADAAQFCGASPQGAHRALSDCRLTLAVLGYIARHPRRRTA